VWQSNANSFAACFRRCTSVSPYECRNKIPLCPSKPFPAHNSRLSSHNIAHCITPSASLNNLWKTKLWDPNIPTITGMDRKRTLQILVKIADSKFVELSPWWWRQYAPLKRRSTSTRLHGAMSHKAVVSSSSCRMKVSVALSWTMDTRFSWIEHVYINSQTSLYEYTWKCEPHISRG
jgi:hypothetical protein